MYQKKFMEQANNLAELNVGTQIGGPFGTVIVKNNKIVGYGRNHVLKNQDPTAHGEVMAIRNACRNLKTHDLTGCELYTNAYPCPMCLGAIIWSNIKTCYYGNTPKDSEMIGFRDDYIYRFISNGRTDKNILDLEQHDRNITQESFIDFKDDLNSTIY